MTIAMLVAYVIGVTPDPIPLAITTGIIAEVARAELITPWIVLLGIIVQIAYGAIWSGLLAVSSRHVTVAKGIVIAIGLWLMMMIFYVPMAGNLTWAVASSPTMWVVSLIFHLIYGATIGLLLQRHQPIDEEATVTLDGVLE